MDVRLVGARGIWPRQGLAVIVVVVAADSTQNLASNVASNPDTRKAGAKPRPLLSPNGHRGTLSRHLEPFPGSIMSEVDV